jgi:pilus assembly protein FimV
MAYNKAKYVDAALKLLHQGKLAQAIAEYQQILKHEPKDQITLMTVGDLFVRQGDTFQALEYFERLAQLYLSDGFVTKAIAIYKKIAKLAPEESRPVEKLAELYIQQGVLSEARPIYLQLSDMHHRANRHEQAAALLRKLLDAEPDNLRAQTKLAEISLAAGLKPEAAAVYCGLARQHLTKGDHAEAIKNIDRAIHIEPANSAANTLKVRIHAASGQQQQAIAMLEDSPDLDQGSESSNLLLDLYLEADQLVPAAQLASRIFARDAKHFAPALRVANRYLAVGDVDQVLVLLDLIRQAMTDAGEHESLSQALAQAAEQFPDRIELLEWLVELYRRISDSFRLPDALANLGRAYEAAGNYDQALNMFEQLLDRDPEMDSVRGECERLRGLANPGGNGNGSQPAPGRALASEPQETAPVSDVAAPVAHAAEDADESVQRFLAQALTDVDLFSSYGLTQKAIELLEAVVNRFPGHPVALERLLDLYLGAGDQRRTAELAAQLEQIYKGRDDSAQAERFAQLRARFERIAPPQEPTEALPPRVAPAAELSIPTVDAEPVPDSIEVETSSISDVVESSVHEVDLSEEWSALVSQVESAAPSDGDGNISLAEAAPEDEIAVGVPDAKVEEPRDQEAEWVLEINPNSGESPAVAETDSHGAADEATSLLGALSAELGVAIPSLAPSPGEPEPRPLTEATEIQPIIEHIQEPVAAVAKDQAGPLADVFDQFRAGLGENSTDDDDPEVHYNLGVAYREMGLLDEAISEFQKVAQAQTAGEEFRYGIQCCTLLGLAFMEQGQPSIAAMWYERALEIPGLDQETVLALRYDLGVAQELAGDASAARKSFTQVYGVNIDYRDVGDRLAALGKE